jgi:hypothetical protein
MSLGWEELLLVVLIGGIIGLAIGAYFSMRGSSTSGPVARDIDNHSSPRPQASRPRQPLVPMQERKAALDARLRQRTGHVDTVMITLPPKDGDQDVTQR